MQRPVSHKKLIRNGVAGCLTLLGILPAVPGLGVDEGSWVEQCNVVWDSPSRDSFGSMPLGNGDIGLNVWVEEATGDLLFYISKVDAYDAGHYLPKLGRVRVRLTPSLFAAGQAFRQSLDLQDGAISISGGSEAERVDLKLWVDAHHPMIHLSGQSARPREAVVIVESLRSLTPSATADEAQSKLPPHGTAGILLDDKAARLAWSYRNISSRWKDAIKGQNSPELVARAEDPIQNLTSGCQVEGPGFVRENATTLRLRKSSTRIACAIQVLSCKTATVGDWFTKIQRQADAARTLDPDVLFAAHRAWWRAFWNRSRIVVEKCGDSPVRMEGYLFTQYKEVADVYWKSLVSESKENALMLTQRHALERFQQACAGRSQVPPPYNGSIFTMDMPPGVNSWGGPKGGPTSADSRDWADLPFMWQNTRHPYWSMAARGDYDTMLPGLLFVRSSLEICKDRCKTWFGHEGAFMTEAMMWNGVSVFGRGEMPAHLQYHFLSSIEMPAIMCEYFEHTQDRKFVVETLLPCADEFIKFYELHFPRRDARGKMLMEPAATVETYQPVTNPVTEISGLRRLLTRLLAMDEQLIGKQRKDHWTALLNQLPGVPTRTIKGMNLLAPGEKYEGRFLVETPELYAVYPFRQACLANDDLLAAARQSFHVRLLSLDGTPDGQAPETGGWQATPIQAAYLGLPREAARLTSINFHDRFTYFTDNVNMKAPPASHPKPRFPAFWETKMDYTPDNDHGGNSANALQSMLLQSDGGTIYLLPAWPEDWDISFKLHAPAQTTVECVYCGGKVESLNVTPESRRKDIINMASAENRVRTLVSVACADRNYLFDIPPMLDGRAAPEDVQRLKTTGQWLAKYGESLYGTRSGPFAPAQWGGSVFKGNVAYLHVLQWPNNGIELPAIGRKLLASAALTGGKPTAAQNEAGIIVNLPEGSRDPVDTIIKLEFDGPLQPIALAAPYQGSLTTGKKVTASSAKAGFDPERAVDADAQTGWAAAQSGQSWLEVDLGQPMTFERVEICLDNPGRVRGQIIVFDIQTKQPDGSWKRCYQGAVYGNICSKRFEPVIARIVRLNTSAAGVRQFDLFGSDQ